MVRITLCPFTVADEIQRWPSRLTSLMIAECTAAISWPAMPAPRARKFPLKNLDVRSQQQARRKRHGQPFMRIESHRVGMFNSANQVAMLSRKEHCSAIGAVNVEPEVVAAANLVNLWKIVDGPRAG